MRRHWPIHWPLAIQIHLLEDNRDFSSPGPFPANRYTLQPLCNYQGCAGAPMSQKGWLGGRVWQEEAQEEQCLLPIQEPYSPFLVHFDGAKGTWDVHKCTIVTRSHFGVTRQGQGRTARCRDHSWRQAARGSQPARTLFCGWLSGRALTSTVRDEGSGTKLPSEFLLNGWKMNFFFLNLGSLNWKSSSVGSLSFKETAFPSSGDFSEFSTSLVSSWSSDNVLFLLSALESFLGDLEGDKQMLRSSSLPPLSSSSLSSVPSILLSASSDMSTSGKSWCKTNAHGTFYARHANSQ